MKKAKFSSKMARFKVRIFLNIASFAQISPKIISSTFKKKAKWQP